MDESSAVLCGLRTAVEELRQLRSRYERNPTEVNKGYIRFAELSVIQMAESFTDKQQNDNNAKDAARWRWLTTECGYAQEDFARWLAGTVASKEEIDSMIDSIRSDLERIVRTEKEGAAGER